MRSGLAIEILIWSKVWAGPTWPKIFINSFIVPSPRLAPGSRGTASALIVPL